MISLTIDDQKIESPEGKKILEAALENGIEIPHLCYHPELKPFGGCRLCIVEVEGESQLISSCVTPVAEGMVVRTATPRLQRARRSILQLLLLNHPMDCLVCDRGGNCALQRLAFALQIVPDKYKMKKRVTKSKQHRSTILEVDPKKCVHCGLCVRACKELVHFGAIDFYNRGFKTDIGIPFADEANCELCGQCVEICPVAGVVGLDSKYVARPWELEKVGSVCPYCGNGCLININTKLNKVVRISSGDKSGTNKGKLCVKGRFGYEFINSGERLTTPLIKKNGQFEKASWDEALSLVADKLGEIVKTHGNQTVGGLGSVKCANEDNYLFQKFLRAVVGTNNIDNYTRLEQAPSINALSKTLGWVTANNTLDQISSSEAILIIGANPSDSHPITALKIKEALDAGTSKLIVVDPRETKLVPNAENWLRIKPGTDLALLGGIMNLIIDLSLEAKEYINKNTSGSEELYNSLKEYTPEKVTAITGISKDQLVQTAKTIAKAGSLSIIYSTGITQHVNGTQNVIALADLFMLTGHSDNEHSGIYPLRVDNNSQGACDMGTLPNYLPGYQEINNSEVREKFNKAWGANLPSTPGLTSTEMFDAIFKGEIKAMYIMGDNPVRSYPNGQNILEALKKLEFLVVQDIFLNQTAQLADVVLPATSFAEREGSVTNMERRVQRISKAVDSPGEALPDWKIISKLSKIMNYPMKYSSVTEIMKEVNELVPIYAGIDYKRLREEGGIYWPCTNYSTPGTKFLKPCWDNNNKANFVVVPPLSSTSVKEEKSFPFKLIVGGTLFHSSTGTLSMKSHVLKDICSSKAAILNPEDAEKLGINDGDTIRISSPTGSMITVAALIPLNPEGIIFIPRYSDDLPTQKFIPSQFDPISHTPAMKVCAVNLTKD